MRMKERKGRKRMKIMSRVRELKKVRWVGTRGGFLGGAGVGLPTRQMPLRQTYQESRGEG